MPYISFNNVIPSQHEDSCAKCIHKIILNNNLCRCSILNKFIFDKQILAEKCTYIDEVVDKHRKVIFGIFIYDLDGNIQWTGMLTYGNIYDTTDNEVILELIKASNDNIYKANPQLKDIHLFYCLIGESVNNSLFVPIGNLLSNTIMNDIIRDANNKFI